MGLHRRGAERRLHRRDLGDRRRRRRAATCRSVRERGGNKGSEDAVSEGNEGDEKGRSEAEEEGEAVEDGEADEEVIAPSSTAPCVWRLSL